MSENAGILPNPLKLTDTTPVQFVPANNGSYRLPLPTEDMGTGTYRLKSPIELVGNTPTALTGDTFISSVVTDAESVIPLGYIPTSFAAEKDDEDEFKTTAFFTVGDSNTFWEMVVTHMSEQHTEKYATHNTLSDAMMLHSLGAAPCHISISGYLASGDDLDTRVRFLRRYVAEFRSTASSIVPKRRMRVRIRETEYLLSVQSMSLVDDVNTEEFTKFTIEGLADEYRHIKEVPSTVYNWSLGSRSISAGITSGYGISSIIGNARSVTVSGFMRP